MIRLSVSDLESFRYWKASEAMEMEDLLLRLRKQEPQTPQMQAGKALAKLFEHAEYGLVDNFNVDGWAFHFNLEGEFRLPPVRELKAEGMFLTPSGPVTLVGQVDGLDGRTIHDQKLTERFDAERYTDSLQWRAYLTMFEADRFIYDIFEASYAGVHVNVYGYHPMPFYAYPGMRKDVERAVCELAEVVYRHMPEKVS